MDINAEAAIFRAIRAYAKDRTVLFVSHRFSTVKEADRILVLDEGRLVEDGTHEQLMKNFGYYASMVRHQRDEAKN
jgi:ATP-binding cassette subfamily B protein/ATP-binding cassette subfamily C protein